MKLLIASDIHGSAAFCRKMTEAWDRENPERVLLLGDLLYHGPRNDLPEGYDPREVIRMLNERKNRLLCVRGNCDTEVDQMVLDFPILADYAWIAGEGYRLFATHGHVYHAGNLPPLCPGDILLHGHTHIPSWEENGSIRIFNPGSVSIPKAESCHGYMMLEDHCFLWKDLDGKIYHMEKAGGR